MKNILLALALLLTACSGDRRLERVLDTADSLLVVSPDSAWLYLQAHSVMQTDGSRRQRMRFELLRATAQNKAYIDFTTDSVMREIVDYYDHHGTANEQLQAHYLLGCVYRDLGDAPRAIECYLDAVAKADTTEKLCDYRTLGATYSQMADMYHKQLLLSNEIESRRKAYHFGMIAGDTLVAIDDLKFLSTPYILQNKEDSAEFILKEAILLYQKYGHSQDVLKASTMLMNLYSMKVSNQKELKILIDQFETECDLFDENHELPPSKRQYYYYKGRYFEMTNQLDSAELCYRKIYSPNMSFTAKDPMYRGLLSVFQKRHQVDSIAKYAMLFAEVNDSSIAVKDQEMTAKMSAIYNYSRYQQQSQKDSERAYQANLRFVVILAVAIILLAVLSLIVKTYHAKQQKKQKEIELLKMTFANTLDLHKQKNRELQQLEDTHQKVLMLIQQELGKAQKENNTYRQKYSEAQRRIEEINGDYEREKNRLEEEIQVLRESLETQKQQKEISIHLENLNSFYQAEIVKKVKDISSNPLLQMEHQDMETLIQAAKDYLPKLIRDLSKFRKTTKQSVCVCVFVAMEFRTDEIANLLGVSGQRVTNIKATLNECLFGDNSAKSLYENLRKRYIVIVQ